MMSNRKVGIMILCEGLEEYKYIRKLTGFPGIFSDKYFFYEPINCKGIQRIFPRFQDLFSKNKYDVILIFCDADCNSLDYKNICFKIDNFMFEGNKVSEKIIMFVNPVTLQIVLSHFADVCLKSSSKAKNEELIKTHTGINTYRAHDKQIDEMMKLIKISTYKDMKKRISKLSTKIDDIPSTNFLSFLENFENDDLEWINTINNITH